jgi:hypothetical protein
VQDGSEADARAQMLRVGGDGGQRLGGGPEQEIVDGGLVVERDGADRRGQGEDDVIVGNGQQLRLAIFGIAGIQSRQEGLVSALTGLCQSPFFQLERRLGERLS